MNQFLFAPWYTNYPMDSARVSVVNTQMRQPWKVYSEYDYSGGVGPKLNTIPRHVWGGKKPNEALYRVPRLVHFVDATGCRPVPHNRQRGIPPSHHRIQTIEHRDHTTYWLGPNDEPLILTEPYWPAVEKIQTEITQRKLAAIALPAPGLYAGGHNYTHSVLMGLPEHQDTLLNTLALLQDKGWPAMSDVIEMDWLSALELSKQQARRAQL